MGGTRFDVAVIGGGPAGSVAALVLARGGARVALVDKATFPRDKACGDMVGPRGLRLLADLGLPTPEGPHVGDMLIVGPTGRRVRLPSAEGLTYPGHGTAVRRSSFDQTLHRAALEAGAASFSARAEVPLVREGSSAEGRLDGYRLSTGEELEADFVIGADGATSGVATSAGLVEPSRVLWGFAIRTYVPQPVELAAIVTWEPTPWNAFPGYGWAFPASGGANIGLGIATRSNRHAGARVVRALPAFLAHLGAIGLLAGSPSEPPGRPLGGWLKMGIVGTTPAAGTVLLVGDAAGLINPLQGEGIAQAMSSGRLAAAGDPDGPGPCGRALSTRHCGCASSVSAHHCRGPVGPGWATTRHRHAGPAAHRGESPRFRRRGVGGLLERVARRRSPGQAPVSGQRHHPGRTHGDQPHGRGALVRPGLGRGSPTGDAGSWVQTPRVRGAQL